MAIIFTDLQIAEIERRIAVFGAVQATQLNAVLTDGRTQVEEARVLLGTHAQTIATHNDELHRSSDRITALVEQVNLKDEELKKLIEDMGGFAAQQNAQLAAFEGKSNVQSATIEQLTRQTEEHLTKLTESLVGIDENISGALESCKAATIAEVNDIRAQTHTFALGAKAEINQIVDFLKSGQGDEGKGGSGFGKGFGGDGGKGSGSGFGKGVDRKEVAVWKLPDDVSKVQFRHWANAVDLQLEAVHGWRHADIILNRVKRSEDPIDADVFERCLHEAGVEIDAIEGPADDFHPHVKHEYTCADRTKFL